MDAVGVVTKGRLRTTRAQRTSCQRVRCALLEPVARDLCQGEKHRAGGIPLEEIERQAVVEALKMSNWVQKDAAELLGISPRVMNYKIKILNIEIPRSRRVVAQTETIPAGN